MKPIIFNTEMVQAILDGRKTQTRRVIKPQPEDGYLFSAMSTQHVKYPYCAVFWQQTSDPCKPLIQYLPCQYKPGDVLYVRETWATGFTKTGEEESIFYKAGGYNQLYMLDGAPDYEDWLKLYDTKETAWRPSIHMPQWAARLFLRVTDVRAQRVQEISDSDARAEGCPLSNGEHYEPPTNDHWQGYGRYSFSLLWDSIYHNWDKNPWVWVYTFERVEKPV
jgi:hypothetical protein